jgi:hypothetical protein
MIQVHFDYNNLKLLLKEKALNSHIQTIKERNKPDEVQTIILYNDIRLKFTTLPQDGDVDVLIYLYDEKTNVCLGRFYNVENQIKELDEVLHEFYRGFHRCSTCNRIHRFNPHRVLMEEEHCDTCYDKIEAGLKTIASK